MGINGKMLRTSRLAAAVALVSAMSPLCASAAKVFEIWPKGRIHLFKADAGPEKVKPAVDENVRFTDVSVPTVTFVKALSEDPVPAVLICPGGGYGHLAWTHEGVEIAQWFKGRGISSFILKYRCPGQRDAAFADAQRAVSFIRANAVNFNIDPTCFGVIGFSAGANLCARLSTDHARRAYPAVDDTDKSPCRPDWSMIIYPWALCEGPDRSSEPLPMKLRAIFPVDRTTTPAFIVQSQDDPCQVHNALAYYRALTLAKVKAEMHLFDKGGHGYGMRERGNPTDCWKALAEMWLAGIVGCPPAQ